MGDGQIALNTNSTSPGLYFKDSNGAVVKVGPVHVGTTAPNASAAVGGSTGNSVGEQWLDTTSATAPVLKIWNGTAWISESGTFVDSTGDTMTGALVMDNQNQIRFRETTANGTNYVAVQAPAALTANKTITLPEVDGTVVTTGDAGSVTSTMIADATIVNGDISTSAAIAFSKLANVSATDRLLGRSTAGAGAIEEVTCTAAGRALIDDADASAQRTTLGLGTMATQTAANYALLASPTFTGTPAVPTAGAGTNTTQIASTAFVTTAVDAARQGLTVKQSCRVATTANITLSATQTIDDIAVVAGNRVLVKSQTSTSQNGIYVVAAGAWTRATDFDETSDLTDGAFTFIEEGTANADSGWVLTTDGAITVGTTGLVFAQFTGAGAITAGNGLTKTGPSIDVVGTAGRIVANADSIDLATAGTAGTYRSVTTDAYGRVTLGTNPTTLSGYGITDAATSTHTHGNITNAGAIGSTANLPIITTTSGALTTGTFGTAANSFCQGNDARLSDTRNTTNALTINNGGSGAASGSTFNGGSAVTISHNTIGAAALSAGNALTGSNTFTNATGQIFRQAATQDGILLRGRAGGATSHTVEIVPATLTASRTVTCPDGNVTLVSGTMVPTTRTLTISTSGGLTGGTAAVDLSANRSWSLSTDATSANTASAIVARDANGDFNTTSINGGPLAGFRNAIINGNFDIWQRGTSFTVTTSGTYTADRWPVFFDGTGATRTISQQSFGLGQTSVPGEPKFFLRFNQSVAGTGSTFNRIDQRIEDVRTFAGDQITISFWAKAAANTTMPSVIIQQYFGSGGATPSAGVNTTAATNVALTTAWQKFSYQVTLPSISGKTLGTDGNDSLVPLFNMPLNATFTIDLAQVQVEAGPVATPFERRPIGTELALCQRYYQTAAASARFNAAGAGFLMSVSIPFAPTMRATPTVTITGGLTVNAVANPINASSIGVRFEISSVASGDAYSIDRTANASAEL